MNTPVADTIRQHAEWDITYSAAYKRLHLRFALMITLLGATVFWVVIFWSDPVVAKSPFMVGIVIMMIICSFLRYYQRKREILPKD